MSGLSGEATPALLWNTLRHLRPQQIAAQAWTRVAHRIIDPARFARRAAPAYPGCRWNLGADLPPPGSQRNRAEQLGRGRFTFINREEELGWPPRWDCPELPRLWQYNLHYFDWLWALDFEMAREGARDWIRRHPLGRQRVGWEPYPVSVRLENWLSLFFGRFRERTEADREWLGQLWHSCFLQAEWLSRRLEYHLMANHLFENAVALTWAGACFEGPAAERWFHTGFALLQRELDEQILADGMHFERSPMYHLRILYLCTLLTRLELAPVRERVAPVARRMLAALGPLRHPDGGIALFNDSAFGICNDPIELIEAARAAPVPAAAIDAGSHGAWALPAAGYYGYRDDAAYVICDAGPVGPDYMLGHAHGDIFSFELSWRGQRVIVDSGVYGYEADEMRRYCRSTRAHNTVEIDGRDQCEFWGAFRVARRGRPNYVDWEPEDGGFRLSGRHDGYRRLAGSPTHQRTLVWRRRTATLEVADRIVARRPVHAASRIHLHPDCVVDRLDGAVAEVAFAGGRVRLRWSGDVDELIREDSFYCPEFGVRRPNTCLSCSSHGSHISMALRIEAR